MEKQEKYKEKKQEVQKKPQRNTNRILLIFVCVFVSAVIAIGGAIGCAVAVKNARAVVRYDSVTVEDGALRYFASYYKMLYIKALRTSGISAKDTDEFWSSESGDGSTYGESYARGFKDYISMLLASCKVFEDYSSYKSEDKRKVAAVADEILEAKAEGSVSVFNERCEKYGFDYNDFCDAIELLYKAEKSKTVIYGENGANLKNFPDECAKYLDTYSHVSLLFVRTEETFKFDSEGNRTYDENGNECMRALTDEEKLEKQGIIDTLTSAIEAKKNGTDMQITPEMFELYLKKSDGDPYMYEKGYYFHENAEMTAEFATAFPEVVERALDMELYEYDKVDCSIGVCFIYKYDTVDGAYSSLDNVFFSDFYSDAADYLYGNVIEIFKPDVRFSDSYDEIDVMSIPYLEEFYVRTWN